MAEAIRVKGMSQFVNNLKAIDRDLPKALRVAFNQAADTIVTEAQGEVPRRSGRARASVKTKSTQKKVRIQGGSKRVPYYPWLDFGGRVGKNRSVRRPFLKDGRYIYDAYFRNSSRFAELLEESLIDTARSAGVEVEA